MALTGREMRPCWPRKVAVCSKPEDLKFLNNVQQYCNSCEAEFIWFCKDIERVYLGKKVDKSQKKAESVIFKANKLIRNINVSKLSSASYQANTSNIIDILDKYLIRKE